MDPDILALAAKAPHWILAVSKNDLNPAGKTVLPQLPEGLREPDSLVSFSSMAPGGLDALVDAVQSCFPAGTPADAGSLPAGICRPPESGGCPSGAVRAGQRSDSRRCPH